jgi:mannose-6-phosphate isomerase-like protein (cupin superfamily)
MELINEGGRDFRHGDHGPKYLFRGPKFEWGIIVFKPGQELGTHCHNEVEEHFYFLEGSAQMTVDGDSFPVKPGDVVRLDPPECHNIANTGDTDLRMVFIKCPYLPTDKVDM